MILFSFIAKIDNTVASLFVKLIATTKGKFLF